jgi:hypothetical protein
MASRAANSHSAGNHSVSEYRADGHFLRLHFVFTFMPHKTVFRSKEHGKPSVADEITHVFNVY